MEIPQIEFVIRKNPTNVNYDITNFNKLCEEIKRPECLFEYFMKKNMQVRISKELKCNKTVITVCRVESAIHKLWDDFCAKYVYCQQCWKRQIYSITTLELENIKQRKRKSLKRIVANCLYPLCREKVVFHPENNWFYTYLNRTIQKQKCEGKYYSMEIEKLKNEMKNDFANVESEQQQQMSQTEIKPETLAEMPQLNFDDISDNAIADIFPSNTECSSEELERQLKALEECLFKDLPDDTFVNENLVTTEPLTLYAATDLNSFLWN